jgi:PLD-like domain
MYNRVIRSHGGSQALKDCLISLFVSETANPSREIYLISPFLSNSPIINNEFGQYTDMFPLLESKLVLLSDILKTLVWKGSTVRVICDPDREETKRFLQELQGKVECKRLTNNHEKGLVTSRFYLHGSMNFTYRGININGEKINITTDISEINQAIMSAQARWEEAEYVEL